MVLGRSTRITEQVTDYTTVRIVPDADGEIISVVVEDASGPLACHLDRDVIAGPLLGRMFLFERVGGERHAWIRVNRLLELAIHTMLTPSVFEDADDPRHMGMGSGPLPFEF